MNRNAWKQSFTALSACLLAASLAFAQQGAQQGEHNARQRDDADPSTGPSDQQVELPQFLNDLDLTSEQKQNFRQALREHNQKLMQTWREFHEQHARAIDLEAAWAVAVRDTLTEEDQRKFDQQRMQDRELNQEGTTERRGTPPPREGAGQDRTSSSPEAREARRQRRQQRQQEDARGDQSDAQARTDEQSSQRRAEEDEEFHFIVFTITSPVLFTQGTSQSDEQKQQCTEACRKYTQELTSVWQDVRRLHAELVKIEADRIEAIEEELTEEQLAQLKEQRQSPSDETASDGSSQRRTR